MPQSQAETPMVVNATRGLMVQVQGSESFLGPPMHYHSTKEGSSIILPHFVLRRGHGRSESDVPWDQPCPTPLNYSHVLGETLTFPPTPTRLPSTLPNISPPDPAGPGSVGRHGRVGDAQQPAGDPAVTMARRQGQEFSC